MGKFQDDVSQIDTFIDRRKWLLDALNYLDCSCDNTQPRGRRSTDGRWYWTIQCLDCGLVTGDKSGRGLQWVKKSHPQVLQAQDYLPIDDELRQSTLKKSRFIASYIYNQAHTENRNYIEDEWAAYNEFLSSNEWQKLRRMILDRDRELCQLEHHGCTKKASIVHHITYVRWRAKLTADLVSCCSNCHQWEHPHLRSW
jgi:5-methylcytosine-specific restriction endonuclease McrA